MTLRDLVPAFGKRRVPVRYDDNTYNLLTDDMNRLFENFFRGFEMVPFSGRTGTFTPRVEVTENEKEIKVSAELPGMDEKDIDISLSDEVLTVSGEKREEKESNGKDYFVKERTYGSFRRTIPLYSEIETEKVEAHFKKGVLTITLPKSAREVEKKKKITVKVE